MTNTSVIFCHYLGLFVTTVIFCHYLGLFVTVWDFCHFSILVCHFLSLLQVVCHYLGLFVTIWDFLSLLHIALGLFVTFTNWFVIFCHFYKWLSLFGIFCHFYELICSYSYNLLKWQKMTNQFIKVTNNLKPIYEYKLDFHSLSFSVVKGQFIMGVGLGVGTLVCWCGNFMSSLFRVWHFKCHP